MGFSITDYLAQFESVFWSIGTMALSFLENISGHAQHVFENGSMSTGIIIGFVLALLFRGIILKLVIGVVLVIVFIQFIT
jgi:hypothetical protein